MTNIDFLGSVSKDTPEWKIEMNKILVEPVNKPFLKYKGSIKIKSGY